MKTRKPTRLKEYDYSIAGWYYITICVKKHVPFFGRIKNGKMKLNKLGKHVNKCWEEIPLHYSCVKLDEYIIMPNHIHGIIIITEKNNTVGSRHASTLHRESRTLSNIVGSFKAAVSKYAHDHKNKNFQWQRSFYDRIIRNEKELYYIRKYIIENPMKWELENNVENLEI